MAYMVVTVYTTVQAVACSQRTTVVQKAQIMKAKWKQMRATKLLWDLLAKPVISHLYVGVETGEVDGRRESWRYLNGSADFSELLILLS